MRHLHNLPTRWLTREAIFALPATLTLKLEWLTTQPATYLREHANSLPNHCMGGTPSEGEIAQCASPKVART
jgi:hypothetical protein